jgi:SsrA-binding protein
LGSHIPLYKPAANAQQNYDPDRTRLLLMHAKEISALIGKLKQKQLSLVPISIYTKSGLIKLELGLARGKKKHEKRESIKKRDIEREIGRKLKS